jgi:hypothetical protein
LKKAKPKKLREALHELWPFPGSHMAASAPNRA